MSVALLLALNAAARRELADASAVAFCRDLEAANLRVPTGVQDFWPAFRGGVLSIRYEPGGDIVENLPVSLKTLASRLLVVYSGQSRLSAGTNWNLTKRFLDGDSEALRHLKGIADVAARVRKCLEAGDIDGVGPLMDEEWNHRRRLADGISTAAIEGLLSRARKAGALGGKACGAGGGGSLAFIVPEGARLDVEQALEREGARILAAHPVERGHCLEIDP
jgi:D-glycero-alpha-D-manno-heptose-7-phosphate kinase